MIAADRVEEASAEVGGANGAVPLALVRYRAADDVGLLLARCAFALCEAGHHIQGIVQISRKRPDRRKCDMFLQNLATGEEVCITEDRGDGARGCRLDRAALAQATLWAEQALALRPQLLVLNKLGKEEALGRGFFPVMAEALDANVPVLIAVSDLNFDAAQALTAGAGTLIEPVESAIVDWCAAVVRSRCGDPAHGYAMSPYTINP